jgi:aspartokinase
LIKISDVIYAIIVENPSLNFAFHHRLLNLSQLARFILPAVATRTRKDVTESAVLMNLSRLQKKHASFAVDENKDLVLDKVTVQSGLCTLTVSNTTVIHHRLNELIPKIRRDGGYVTMTEGVGEITAIMEDEYFDLGVEALGERPRNVHRRIASVGVKFSERILHRPGIIYQVLQQVVLQNINVIEVASTATELNIYLTEDDVEHAFESIFRRFSRSKRS